MTRLLFKLVFFLLFFAGTFYAQTFVFTIKGNKNIENKQYLNWLGEIRAKDRRVLKDSIISTLSEHLAQEGYFNFKIDSVSFGKDSSKTFVSISLTEGKPTTINKIILRGLSTEDSLTVLPLFRQLNGKVFSVFVLEGTIKKALQLLGNNGYPFAEFKIASIIFNNDTTKNPSVKIYLQLDKKEKATIDKIIVSGNMTTSDYVITREFRFDKGETYSEKKISAGLEALRKTDFFKEISKPEFYLDAEGKGVLQIRVKEKSTNNFNGVIGYVPAKDNKSKGYFTGNLNISLRNLFGTGRAFAFRWLQENKYSQELELKYLEPWIFSFPVNIFVTLYQRKKDTTYVKRKLNLEATYIATDKLSASVLLGSESTIPTISKSNNLSVFNSSSFNSGVLFRFDSRDNFLAPKKGAVFQSTYKFTQKKIYGPKELLTTSTKRKIFVQRWELNFAYFYEITESNIVALNFTGKEVKGSQLDISDLYLIGGTNSVRGYREKQFAGNRVTWGNAEYRYLIDNESFLFLFYDAGYFLESDNVLGLSKKSSKLLSAYGLGISLSTGFGILKVSYAVAKGNSLNEGFIHFGLQNKF